MAEKFVINARIETIEEVEADITIKVHKESFLHKLSLRLINPYKSDIGKISKNLLDKTNKILILNTIVNQCKSTTTVIDWFENVPNKKTIPLHTA